MDKLRLTEKNRISNEIKTVEVSLKRSQATLDRLKGQDASVFTKTQIEKLSTLIVEYKKKMDEMEQKIVDVGSGKLDSELYNSNSNVIQTIQKKSFQVLIYKQAYKSKSWLDLFYKSIKYSNYSSLSNLVI